MIYFNFLCVHESFIWSAYIIFFFFVITYVEFQEIWQESKTLVNRASNFKFELSPSLAQILNSMSSRARAQLGFSNLPSSQAKPWKPNMKSLSLEQARAARYSLCMTFHVPLGHGAWYSMRTCSPRSSSGLPTTLTRGWRCKNCSPCLSPRNSTGWGKQPSRSYLLAGYTNLPNMSMPIPTKRSRRLSSL